MTNLVFIDNPQDVYIHEVTQKVENMKLNDNIEFIIEDDTDEDDTEEENCSITDVDYDKIVLSIDIGILNLGISVGLIDKEFNLKEVTYVDLIDITKYTHERQLDNVDCKLHHTKSIADWMEHIFHEHSPLFEEANYILVERQPPQGLVAIEQLIYYRWRNKCHLISPSSMHKHYCIGHYDYDQRKEQTMYIAKNKYNWHQRAIEQYNLYERKHDMTDSICLMGFWLHKKKVSYMEKKRQERFKKVKFANTGQNMNEWFEQYRYIPRVY